MRGNDILGLVGLKGADKLPYPTLSYANGLGFYETYAANGSRLDLTNTDFTNPRLRYIATAPLESETHGGDDVGIYASGPRSDLFVGNYEQSNIPMLMAFAAQIGPYDNKKSSASIVMISMPIILLTISLLFQ